MNVIYALNPNYRNYILLNTQFFNLKLNEFRILTKKRKTCNDIEVKCRNVQKTETKIYIKETWEEKIKLFFNGNM